MVFEDSELVMYKKDGKIYGGGFTVNSIMMQHGISPITRVNVGGGAGSKKGGGGTDSFANLAIPAGLYYFDTGLVGQSGGRTQIEKDHMDDDMYSTLMDLAGNVTDEYVGGDGDDGGDGVDDVANSDDGDDGADSDDGDVADGDRESETVSLSSGGKKHKKTKKQRLSKKGRKTRKT